MELFPSVSVVIVNRNGKEHLSDCIGSLMKLKYPKEKIQIVVVDNASTDGSVELLHSKFQWVRLIRNQHNEGFAKPCNDGARAVETDYVAFLNNDMRVKRDWLIELVNTLRSGNAQCAGSVLLNWNGKALDFAGGSLSFYGMGYQFHFGESPAQAQELLNEDHEILFACGGAMIVERQLFLAVGGFDEDFFAYFEDLDLGWRMKLLGYKTVLSVRSQVYHKHHSTAKKFPFDRLSVFYERNKLYMLYKNYSDEMLHSCFFPALLLDFSILFERSGISRDEFSFSMPTDEEAAMAHKISGLSGAQLCAISDFINNLSVMTEKRKYIQQNRKTPDDEIIPFIPQPFVRLGRDEEEYNNHLADVVKAFGVDKAFGKEFKYRVLLVCSDRIGVKMAGPAVRYYEFAKVLSKTCDVVLASFGDPDITSEEFRIINYTYEDASPIISEARNSDIILVQGLIAEFCPEFAEVARKRYLIIDLYDPYVIENMEIFKDYEKKRRYDDYMFTMGALKNQLQDGDFFLCANEKQKDYWFGMLSALDRVDPAAYDISRDGSKLISVVPFGVSDEAPVHTRNVLKGVWPGIEKDDKVLIWGGGVWNWFDPLTLIKAVEIISRSRTDVKLFFLGVKHPNPAIPGMQMLTDAVELAKKTGLYERQVFFNFGWVDYNDRQNYLTESDIGVSCHFETLETRFSFRTRVLDYLWAGLPIICTKGDHFAAMVEKKKLGFTVDYEDEGALAQAILALLDDREYYEACRANIAVVADTFKWSKITKPLIDFCSHPVHPAVRQLGQFTDESETHDVGLDQSKGSVMKRLNKIESNQKTIASTINKAARQNRDTMDNIKEIQDWTYMMNNRFNRLKTMLNPFRVFARRIKRR
ncbi:MAG: glycosyltransferase [Clostridia bacterium]|nr:glycosyltransferase [Clostridia bacterium]MDR3643968.1 glycosyltransferase [Clostridia bacterium]